MYESQNGTNRLSKYQRKEKNHEISFMDNSNHDNGRANEYLRTRVILGGEDMQRIRTINKAFDEIKQQDPETALSLYLIRQMVKQGLVPSIKAGNKRLVDVDVLQEYINKFAGVN